jgi:hydroxylamine reductase
MFCYQCEQTARGTGCTKKGVCGKDGETAALQDLLLYATKGIAMYAHRARALDAQDRAIDLFALRALFTTVTNVSFDPDRIAELIATAAELKNKARKLYASAATDAGGKVEELAGPAAWEPAGDRAGLLAQAGPAGFLAIQEKLGQDRGGLVGLVTFGLKGLAAYAYHAGELGVEDDAVYAFVHETLDALTADDPSVEELTTLALRVGEMNLRAMEILDEANTGAYGHPEPTQVRVEPLAGKAILVSGHDLRDLKTLLEQTEGKGISVYTHGEMLPAHAYPGLKKHAHLAGNYGSAWQNQRKEFDAFPGAILMTTNCIQKPSEDYMGRIFTSGPVAFPGVTHVDRSDFSAVIEAAQAAPGFEADGPEETITVGFGRNAVMAVAGKVVDAVKSGAVRHFFLIGGCDGAKPGRNYYTDLARAVPDDCIILTLACGKYRFNRLDFGEIGGIPRLLDLGQCNDAYSAVQIASALAQAFDTDVNGLPLSIVCSWFEQKAVAILLTLLHLGIKNIRLGPSLPAFVTPAVLNVLVETFDLKPIATVEEDLAAMLGKGE